MKKSILTSIALFVLIPLFAQTAANWTASDCSGKSHTLFSELDAGKVVVISWVMPCGSCISPASTAANTVKGMNNPNVVYYLCDDKGDSPCNTVNNWANTNSITSNAVFSNASIKMSDYGTAGMPKTVVLGGGTCHTVYFNQNGSITQSALQTAINNALSSCATAISENYPGGSALAVFPNPASSTATIGFTLPDDATPTIELINLLGETIQAYFPGKQSAGKLEYEINVESLPAGTYFIRLNTGEKSETLKLIVARQ